MVKRRKPKKAGSSLGIRPSPSLREKLRLAAEANGRSINKEAEARLASSFGEGDPGPFAGWPAQDQERFRTLASTLGLLNARVTLSYGYDSETDLHSLGAFQVALAEFFDQLKIHAPAGEHKGFFAMQGRQLLAEMLQASNIKNPAGEKALLADFAKAWGVSGEGVK
jgi:hypothetical protein